MLELPRYDLVAWLFLRGLGLIYLAAFVSVALQILGLVGSDGILPLGEYLDTAHAGWGTDAYWRLPTQNTVSPSTNTARGRPCDFRVVSTVSPPSTSQ
jgi:hypothetical protein